MQFQADILGVPVVSAQNVETTAMGRRTWQDWASDTSSRLMKSPPDGLQDRVSNRG